MADLKATVSIERAMVDVLVEYFQNVEEKFGITVSRVDIDWIDVSTHGHKKCLAKNIRVEMNRNPM